MAFPTAQAASGVRHRSGGLTEQIGHVRLPLRGQRRLAKRPEGRLAETCGPFASCFPFNPATANGGRSTNNQNANPAAGRDGQSIVQPPGGLASAHPAPTMAALQEAASGHVKTR